MKPTTAEKSQGWTPFILDTNGNGKRDEYTEPGQPMDPTKDMRIKVGFYGVSPSPADGSIWGTVLGFPGSLVRLNPGLGPRAHVARGNLRSAVEQSESARAGFLTARNGYHSRWCDLDRACQRALRQF